MMNKLHNAIEALLRKFQESEVKRDARGRFANEGGSSPSVKQTYGATSEFSRTPRGMTQNIWEKRNAQTPEKIKLAAARLEVAASRRDGGDWTGQMAAQTMRDKAESLRFAAETVTPSSIEESRREFRQQIPKALGQEKHFENLRRLQRQANDMRASAIEKAITPDRRGKTIIPEGTPISDIKRAYRHATATALNDAYLIEYDWKMSPEDIKTFKPLEPFIRYSARRMKSEFTAGENKGMSAPYKAEYGVPFIDKATGKQKVNRMTGELRVRPPKPTNNQFVKADIPLVRDPRWLDRLQDAIELQKADDLADEVLEKASYRALIGAGRKGVKSWSYDPPASKTFNNISAASEQRVLRLAAAAKQGKSKLHATIDTFPRRPGRDTEAPSISTMSIGRNKSLRGRSVYYGDDVNKADGLAKSEPTHIRDLL